MTVRSAVPLDDGQVAALRDRVVALIGGATPMLHFEVDPGLIGGLVVQVGDVVYDASARSRIGQFHRQILDSRLREIQSRGHELMA